MKHDFFGKFNFYSLAPITRVIAKIAYGISPKRVKIPKNSLILYNHTSDMDVLLISKIIRSHFYLVASSHVENEVKLGKFLKWLFHFISVKKGSVKTQGTMEIVRSLRQGNSIALAPEGRLSHNGYTCSIDPSISKLIKISGANVVTIRIKGGFFKQPRWQLYLNKGKLFSAEVVNIYSPSDIKSMTDDELYSNITKDLYVDAYKDQEEYMHKFVWKHGIEDITRFYCVCPKCKSIDTLKAEGMTIKCDCGFSLTMNEYGFFEDNQLGIKKIPDIEKIQNDKFKELFEKSETFFTDNDVSLLINNDGKKSLIGTGCLKGTNDGFIFNDIKHEYKDLDSADILKGGSSLVFTSSGTHYELYKEKACLNKYYQIYLLSKI